MPLILLAPDPDEGPLSRWWRTKSPGFRWLVWIGVSLTAVAIVLLSATALTAWLFEGDGGAAGAGDDAGATGARSAAVGAAGSSAPLESLTFATLADSLGARIRSYHAAGSATDGTGCEALAEAYGRVDDAFLALAVKMERGDEAGLADRRARFRELAAAVEAVEASFDASGCPRPD